MAEIKLIEIYSKLLGYYGKQNWWPLSYNFKPKEWEICVGAILTQNTNWGNVEKALLSLKNANCLTVNEVLNVEQEKLEGFIRSSGFYRQKAERLKILGEFILGFGSFKRFVNNVKRVELLKVRGIGKETCDSILLYACNRPYFVIDAYTKRLCNKLGIVKNNYEDYRLFFESNLPKDIELYKEFHALIVRCGKDKFKEFQ